MCLIYRELILIDFQVGRLVNAMTEFVIRVHTCEYNFILNVTTCIS